ncbi:MAG: hypothetical protein Q8904_03785 [Bacteroidota bacterium]|nr:hypothetical protein [Bacteroidota bacterium]
MNTMITNAETDPWCLLEDGFHEQDQLISEDVFSLGNGQIEQRANLEEFYSGKTILGSYIPGIYYPEDTKRSIWKNGDAGTTVNAPNWTGIIIRLNEEKLDLATWEIQNFKRILNMREGFLERTFEAISLKGHQIQVSVKRFLSMAETEVGAIHYSVKSLNFEGRISFMPILDGDLKDQLQDRNEPIWNVLQTKTQSDVAHLWMQTRHTDFHVCQALTYALYKNNELLNFVPTKIEKEKIAGFSIGTDVKKNDTVYLNKYVSILNSQNHPRNELTELACVLARASRQKGWKKLMEEHTAVWTGKWNDSGISDDGGDETQRIIRYKLFRNYQGLDSNDETQRDCQLISSRF